MGVALYTVHLEAEEKESKIPTFHANVASELAHHVLTRSIVKWFVQFTERGKKISADY